MQAVHPKLVTRYDNFSWSGERGLATEFPLYNTEGWYTSCFYNWQVIHNYCEYILRIVKSVEVYGNIRCGYGSKKEMDQKTLTGS